MKTFIILGLAIILSSCSGISERSVTEKLSIDELSSSIKFDTSFASFYERARFAIDDMSDVEKAIYYDVSYEMLFNFSKFPQKWDFTRDNSEWEDAK